MRQRLASPIRFGIRPQIGLLVAIPLVALVVLLAIGVMLAKQTQISQFDSARLATELAASQRLIGTLASGSHDVTEFVRVRDSANLTHLHGLLAGYPAQVAAFEREMSRDRGLHSASVSLGNAALRGMRVLAALEVSLRAGDLDAVRRMAAEPATRDVNVAIERSSLGFEQTARNVTLASLQRSRTTTLNREHALVASAIVGVVATLSVALLFGYRIVRRLRMLEENARRVALGEPMLLIAGRDEITRLDRTYRAMAEQIERSSRAHQEAVAALGRERDVATMLQRALLPNIAPIRGVRIDTAYLTPSEGAQIGGDWFDVFELDARRVALSIGDVTGHGVRAAATMGSIRHAMRVVARLVHDPQAVLTYVNRIVCDDERDTLATAMFGVFDRSTGMLHYAMAGHAPPLVVARDGHTALLDGDGLLLGIDRTCDFSAHEYQLEPGDAIVLYTDGIVEARRDYLAGMVEFEAAVRAVLPADNGNAAEAIQRRVFADAPPRDDCALLVMRVTELAPMVDPPYVRAWHFDARDRDTAHGVKREMLAAVDAAGMPGIDLLATEIVFGELLGNVVRHTPGPARVEIGVEAGRVLLRVVDRGGPLDVAAPPVHAARSDDAAESGRGLQMIRQLCEQVAVEEAHDGKAISVIVAPGSFGEHLPLP